MITISSHICVILKKTKHSLNYRGYRKSMYPVCSGRNIASVVSWAKCFGRNVAGGISQLNHTRTLTRKLTRTFSRTLICARKLNHTGTLHHTRTRNGKLQNLSKLHDCKKSLQSWFILREKTKFQQLFMYMCRRWFSNPN